MVRYSSHSYTHSSFLSTLPSSFSHLFFFFFNDPATTEIYTLSLHDALPICRRPGGPVREIDHRGTKDTKVGTKKREVLDRKSTRLNSSHMSISYAVFCLKKKKKKKKT